VIGTVIVSPHLDDAVLSVFAVLDTQTTVVTVFAGLPPAGILSPWDAASGATDSRQRIAERRDEDLRALERSGARAVHLAFHDRQYAEIGAVPRPTVQSVAEGLREHVVGAESVFAPAALSANSRNPIRRRRRNRASDHRLVRDAVFSLRPDARLYAELPYALSVDRGFVLPGDLDPHRWQMRSHVLVDEVVRAKVEAVRCYTTQLPPLIRIFGDFVTPSLLGREVIWEPSW
jgi:LmbE family N-acetylglucosaminyl deacetylase